MQLRNTKRRFMLTHPLTTPIYDDNCSEYTRPEMVTMLAWRSQVVLFDAAQVSVFWDIIERGGYLPPPTEVRLPFDGMWIELSEPLFTFINETDMGISPCELSVIFLEQRGPCIMVYLIRNDNTVVGKFDFTEENPECIDEYTTGDICKYYDYERFLPLVNACIQYINCENVYLEKQGDVPESVNRKREKKGKSRLEPYYICRIRGVQYDSHATGEGSKHGIRYDVRGHFRRLETGKTIWVRPHQRGLQNELYVPKVYRVEKGSKPEWQA